MPVYGVSVADLLYANARSEHEKWESTKQFYRIVFSITHALDLLCAGLFLLSSCGWQNISECAVGSIFRADGYNLKTGAGVCFTLAFSRLIVFPAVSYIAIKYGVESAHLKERLAHKENLDEDSEEQLRERLLDYSAEIEEAGRETERNKAKHRAKVIKYTFLSSVFIFSCGYQIYSGVKVSLFHWNHDKTFEIVLMCLSVLWINLQAYFYRSWIEDATQEKGLYFKQVHKHPLFWTTGVILHRCDLCKESIDNSIGGCFRCRLCDYDVCIKCAQRSDIKDVGEDLIRTDRGVKNETTVSSAGYFKRAMKLTKEEWPLIVLAFICIFFNAITNLLLPHIQGKIINDLIADDSSTFKSHVLGYLFVMLAQGFLNGAQSFMLVYVFRVITFHVRVELFNNILKQDIAFFDGTTSGHLTSKLLNDVSYMMDPIRNSMGTALQSSILLFGGVFMCYYNSYKLALLAFVTVGPIMFLWDLYGQYSKKLNRKLLTAWGHANSNATEALNHVRDVKSFCNEEHEVNLYKEACEVALQAGIKDAFANGGTQMLTGYMDLGTGVLILWLGGFLALQGSLSVGELVAFQFYWNMMNNAYQSLQGLLVQFTQSAAAAEKVFSLWDNVPDIGTDKGRDIDWDVKGKLTMKNVSYYYQMRPDNIVLQDFSLTIPGGSVCAFVGRSGGGKSTVVRLLLRFYDPKAGHIYLDDVEYTSLKVTHLRRHFGCVAQSTTLFAKSILYNITYGLDPSTYTMEDVINACKKAQCYEFIESFKDKFETRCGEAGLRISGGQAQRIAIARVFLRKPKLVLLDEATSALDEDSQKKVQDALDTLLAEKNCTVVIVAHRLSTVRFADKIAVVDKGKVLEEGSHEELMELENGVYKQLVQLKVESDRTVANGDSNAKPSANGVEEMMEQIMKEREQENENGTENGEVHEEQK